MTIIKNIEFLKHHAKVDASRIISLGHNPLYSHPYFKNFNNSKEKTIIHLASSKEISFKNNHGGYLMKIV